MPIVLYRRGSRHVVEGVPCEIGRFPASQLAARLAEGWYNDPRNIDAEEWETTSAPVETSDGETGATTPEEAQTSNETPVTASVGTEGEQSEEAIRQAAKAANIRGWHNTGIEKLKAKLADLGSE